MNSRLETAANIAILVVSGVVIAQTAALHLGVRRNGAAVNVAPMRALDTSGYKPGESLGAITGITYGKSQQSLLVYIKSSCTYCTASMPFYRKLVEAAEKAQPSQVQIIAVSTDPETVSRAYVRAHRLGMSTVTVPRGALRVSGTPTILLVDRAGAVQRVWRGQLSPGGEAEVLAILNGTSARAN